MSAPQPGVYAPAVAESSAALPAVRRPWGLIAVILVIDLGLAAAGVWLLREGLSTPVGSAPRAGASGPR